MKDKFAAVVGVKKYLLLDAETACAEETNE